jgi:hypothetical protein
MNFYIHPPMVPWFLSCDAGVLIVSSLDTFPLRDEGGEDGDVNSYFPLRPKGKVGCEFLFHPSYSKGEMGM